MRAMSPRRVAARPAPLIATPKRGSARPRARAGSPPPRTLFHGPSFSAGLIAGAIAVLVGAYVPELLDDPTAGPAQTAAGKPNELRFEFHDILSTSTVDADESVYQPPPKAAKPRKGGGETVAGNSSDRPLRAIVIQAASFRAVDDAESLRARLLLQDLPVSMARVEIASGTWYRITVGPFASRADADRAMTRLREQNIDAIFI
jgi:hypothetical protein